MEKKQTPSHSDIQEEKFEALRMQQETFSEHGCQLLFFNFPFESQAVN